MANREILYKYLGNRCWYCGVSVSGHSARYGNIRRSFELHHIEPSLKHPDYKNLIRRKISTEVLDETDKCILLCTMCHSIIHGQSIVGNFEFTDPSWHRNFNVPVSVIFDLQERRINLLSNTPYLPNAYCIHKGVDGDTEILYGHELNSGPYIGDLIRSVSTYEVIDVHKMGCRSSVFRLTSEEKGNVCMRINTKEFPFLKMSLDGYAGKRAPMLIRNGKKITDDSISEAGIIKATITPTG